MEEILLHHAELPPDVEACLDAAWIGIVPGALAARLARIREPRARLETLLGYALLSDCARAAGWRPPGPDDLCLPVAAKPRWNGGPQFSISHAGGRVACALSVQGVDGIGLDLEPVDDVAADDLRLVASAGEMQEFAAAGLGAADLWTSKEAVIKAAGATLADLGRVEARCVAARFDGAGYRLQRVDLDPTLSCTVASRSTALLSVVRVDARRVLETDG